MNNSITISNVKPSVFVTENEMLDFFQNEYNRYHLFYLGKVAAGMDLEDLMCTSASGVIKVKEWYNSEEHFKETPCIQFKYVEWKHGYVLPLLAKAERIISTNDRVEIAIAYDHNKEEVVVSQDTTEPTHWVIKTDLEEFFADKDFNKLLNNSLSHGIIRAESLQLLHGVWTLKYLVQETKKMIKADYTNKTLLKIFGHDFQEVEYKSSWANSTGYFDGAMEDTSIEVPSKFKDEFGRIGLIIPMKNNTGNLVIFQRRLGSDIITINKADAIRDIEEGWYESHPNVDLSSSLTTETITKIFLGGNSLMYYMGY